MLGTEGKGRGGRAGVLTELAALRGGRQKEEGGRDGKISGMADII